MQPETRYVRGGEVEVERRDVKERWSWTEGSVRTPPSLRMLLKSDPRQEVEAAPAGSVAVNAAPAAPSDKRPAAAA